MATKPVELEIAVNVSGDGQLADLGNQLDETTSAAKAMGDESTGAAGGLDALAGGAGAAAGDAQNLGDALGSTADAAGALGEESSGAADGLGDLSSGAGAAADDASALGDALGGTADAAGALGEESSGAADGLGDLSGGAGAAADDASALGDALGGTADAAGALGDQSSGAAGGLGDMADGAGAAADDASALGDALGGTADAADTLGEKSAGTSDGLSDLANQVTDVTTALLTFVGLDSLAGAAENVGALADEWKNLRARLQLALGAQTDVNRAMEDVVGVSQRTYSSLSATAELYGKIASIGKDMGIGQQQALKLTETINQAVQLSGASAQSSEAAITQLIQGLQSGVVRGDEFNSIMEQSPRLAQALAAGLNVPIGMLRSLAEQGKLTSTEIIRALTEQSEVIGKEFGSLPVTIGRAVQNLQTEWQKFVGALDSSTGASAVAVAGIKSLTTHLEDIARIASAAGAAMLAGFAVQAVQALRMAMVQMQATGGAAVLLRRELDTLSKPVTIVIAAAGFEVGYEIGTMLRENFALARQFGVGVVGFFALLVNDLQMLKETASAVFTDDTVNAALERYKQRNIEIGGTLKAMFEDAKKAPNEIGAAADKAAQSAKQLADEAQAAGVHVAAAGVAGAAGVGQITTAAQAARTALEGLAAAVNAKPTPDNGLDKISDQIKAAMLRGEDLALLLRKNLPDAIEGLSGPGLVKFRAEFVSAMNDAVSSSKTLQQAYKLQAEQAIAANGGVATEVIKTAAALRGLKVESDSSGKAMVTVMDTAGLAAKGLRAGLILIGEQAAQSLGVDVPLATNKISKSFEEARGTLSVLIRSLPELKAAGVDTATLVAQAMAKMIDGAKSQAEIDSVTRQVKVLRDQLGIKLTDGLLDQAKQKAVELSDAMDKATPGINSLKEAMKELGLQSTASLKDAAKNASEAFDVIKAKGQEEGESYVAWQARKQDAARVMLERAIAANRGVADAATITKAAMEGLEIQTDSTGKSIVAAMDKGSDAAKGLGDAVKLTTEQIKAQEDAADRLAMKYKLSADYTERQLGLLERENALVERRNALERERLNIDKEGYSLNTAGERVNAQGESQASIYERAKGAGLTEAQALKLSNETALPYNGPSIKVASPLDDGANWSTNLQKKIDQFVLSNANANAGSSTQTKTYKVDLNVNGQINSFGMASDSDAQKLIKALQSAQLTAS